MTNIEKGISLKCWQIKVSGRQSVCDMPLVEQMVSMAIKFSRFKVGMIIFNLIYKTSQLDLYTKIYEFLKLTLESRTFFGPVCIKW